jgi:hypothetical protein
MNGITFIALVFLGYCIIKFAFKVIEHTAQDIAREQGERRELEWRSMRQRQIKTGDYNVNENWK